MGISLYPLTRFITTEAQIAEFKLYIWSSAFDLSCNQSDIHYTQQVSSTTRLSQGVLKAGRPANRTKRAYSVFVLLWFCEQHHSAASSAACTLLGSRQHIAWGCQLL